MTWWQNWRHALAHPSDNVVAALIVLVGVVTTVSGTLAASYFTRRHERRKEALDRIFQPRADIYLEVRDWLRRDMEAAQFSAQHRTEASVEGISVLSNRLAIYGAAKVQKAFVEGLRVSKDFHDERLRNASAEELKKPQRQIEDGLRNYDKQVRKSMLRRSGRSY